ncbi:isochorismatase hydrolase [Liquorilactobacillus aquaticus DSM 21051]|uniref:Isochorismatase hydrolase n=1 Tax=Liquorilactobacillus aquaticus DSM 21051 TaxID=1423725 RepID=A0A0R2D3I5_9LACO|nr:cysteine hydrolase family protein [Liquorilactobacillus aquaticus]KRM95177.1 isochorismatase hydrolase [Liquorilactobacillus aquaticus DSM 21051]
MVGDALLIVDVQNGVCHNAESDIYQFKQLIAGILNRTKEYTAKNKPIIVIQHQDEELVKGSEAWRLVSELELPDEVFFLAKKHANSFYQTDLKKLLTHLNIAQIELCGAQTEYCIDATAKFAHGLGYNLLMCHGLTTTWDNQFMTARQTINFYESIWDKRFVRFID